jgi:hypothetical protein
MEVETRKAKVNEFATRRRALINRILGNRIVELHNADTDQSQIGGNDNIKQRLTSGSPVSKDVAVTKQAEAMWHWLRKRLEAATRQRGAKAQLAREFKVSPQAVSQWIIGQTMPAAGTVLALQQWVETKEGQGSPSGKP